MELTQKIVIGIITVVSIHITFTCGGGSSSCLGRGTADNKKETEIPLEIPQEELFAKLMDRLQEYIVNNGVRDLKFTFTARLRNSIYSASEKFKISFLKHATELENTEPTNEKIPVTALKLSIDDIFDYYMMRMTKKSKTDANIYKSKMEYIKKHDPMGLVVYITKEMNDNSEKYGDFKDGGVKDWPKLRKHVNWFHETLESRVKLHDKQTEQYATELNIPFKTLVEFTTERMDLSDDAIYRFMLIVNSTTNYKMHEIWKYQLNNEYVPHTDVNANDVQIFLGVEEDVKGYGHGHYICTQYNAAEKKILIYDSKNFGEIGNRLKKVLYEKLYIFKPPPPIKFVRLPYSQLDGTSCGIYAIAYATALIIGGVNLANVAYPLNVIYGDESLYMRLHLLKILKDRKLTLFPQAEE